MDTNFKNRALFDTLRPVYRVDSTWKRRENCFHVVSMWSPRAVFVGMKNLIKDIVSVFPFRLLYKVLSVNEKIRWRIFVFQTPLYIFTSDSAPVQPRRIYWVTVLKSVLIVIYTFRTSLNLTRVAWFDNVMRNRLQKQYFLYLKGLNCWKMKVSGGKMASFSAKNC